MGGVIKIYGIILMGTVGLFLLVNVGKRIFLEDDIFESTRTTQLSVIQESMNLGDLFVHGEYSITVDEVMTNWISKFEENRNKKLHYVIDFIDVHETPPAIAVRIRGYTSLSMHEDELELDYTNVVLVDERGLKNEK